MLRKELQDRLEERGWAFEWADVIQDLDSLQDIEVEQRGRRFVTPRPREWLARSARPPAWRSRPQ